MILTLGPRRCYDLLASLIVNIVAVIRNLWNEKHHSFVETLVYYIFLLDSQIWRGVSNAAWIRVKLEFIASSTSQCSGNYLNLRMLHRSKDTYFLIIKWCWFIKNFNLHFSIKKKLFTMDCIERTFSKIFDNFALNY